MYLVNYNIYLFVLIFYKYNFILLFCNSYSPPINQKNFSNINISNFNNIENVENINNNNNDIENNSHLRYV